MAIIQRLDKKVFKRNIVKCYFVGCGQINQGGNTMQESLFPPQGAKTPPVTRLQPRESGNGYRTRQIITLAFREFQEFLSYLDTNSMNSMVIDSYFTAAFPGKTGQWVDAAYFQRGAENIFNFSHTIVLFLRSLMTSQHRF
jgi:hypothetical protein